MVTAIKNKIYCKDTKDIPTEQHWAIVTFVSVTTPGDERSRTHPGHGYPESTENHANYVAYLNKNEWERDVISLTKEGLTSGSWRQKTFTAMEVNPAVVSTSVNVSVG